MSICPKGKTSKAKRNQRRASSYVIPTFKFVRCQSCGELVKAHAMCKVCGMYKKQTVLKVDD